MPALQIPLELRHRTGFTVGAMFLDVHIAQILRGIVGTRIDLDGLFGSHGVLFFNCCIGRGSRGLVLFDAHTGRVAGEAIL